MKHTLHVLFLLAVLAALFCLCALAAGESGIYAVTEEAGVTVTPLDADDNPVAAGTTDGVDGAFYANAVKLKVSCSGLTNGAFCLALVQDADGAPVESNIVYIDQQTVAGGKVEFIVYPSKLESGKTYTIYLSTSDGTGLQAKASFQYYVAYTKGDVNEDGVVDELDAVAILRHAVGLKLLTGNKLLAAEVNDDGVVDELDAVKVLRFAVGLITKL